MGRWPRLVDRHRGDSTGSPGSPPGLMYVRAGSVTDRPTPKDQHVRRNAEPTTSSGQDRALRAAVARGSGNTAELARLCKARDQLAIDRQAARSPVSSKKPGACVPMMAACSTSSPGDPIDTATASIPPRPAPICHCSAGSLERSGDGARQGTLQPWLGLNRSGLETRLMSSAGQTSPGAGQPAVQYGRLASYYE
jgi:hypothetical protein